jgi:hypothetical protein
VAAEVVENHHVARPSRLWYTIAHQLAARADFSKPNADAKYYATADDNLSYRYEEAGLHKTVSDGRDANQLENNHAICNIECHIYIRD